MDLSDSNIGIYSCKDFDIKNPGEKKFLQDYSLKVYSVVYYFFLDFSFSSSLSLSDGFQTLISVSFVISDPGRT